MKIPAENTARKPSPELRRRHNWTQIMAYFYCDACDTTALKLDSGELIGIDSRLDPRPAVNIQHCGGNNRKRKARRLRQETGSCRSG